MVGMKPNLPSWVDLQGNISDSMFRGGKGSQLEQPHRSNSLSDANLNFGERALSAAGAAVLSAILVNPLDVAKVCYISMNL